MGTASDPRGNVSSSKALFKLFSLSLLSDSAIMNQTRVSPTVYDVMYEIQTMARFSSAPKQEHLKRMIRVFGYHKNHAKHGIMVDTWKRICLTTEDGIVNLQEQYPGANEELPHDLPTPKGKNTYVDADHVYDQVTRRSVTGILPFVNNTPIKGYSKRHNTVETSIWSWIGMNHNCNRTHHWIQIQVENDGSTYQWSKPSLQWQQECRTQYFLTIQHAEHTMLLLIIMSEKQMLLALSRSAILQVQRM